MFRNRNVRIGLAATFLVVTAHFGTYIYVEPFLERVTRVGTGRISTFLLIYGLAGLLGNFVAGSMITRALRGTWVACAVLIATASPRAPRRPRRRRPPSFSPRRSRRPCPPVRCSAASWWTGRPPPP